MKVAIDFESGTHWMYDPLEYYVTRPSEEWLAANTIEIPDAQWAEWRKFQAESRKWNEVCLALGNEIYERGNR